MTQIPENTVSIIIAAYNAAETIERAINSALPDPSITEIIVVDDASTDNTVEIVKTLCAQQNRLKIFTQDHNQGPSAARNKALEECTSTWISILDADDFLLENRTSKLLNFTENYDLITDDMFQVTEENIKKPKETLLRPPLINETNISLAEFVESNITKGKRTRSELGFIKPLIRRSKLQEHKITYQEHMRLGEDYELYVRLLAHGAKMKIVPAQGYVSVRRENSLSGLHSIDDLRNLRDCNIRIIKDIALLSPKEKKIIKRHYISIDCRYQWRCLIEAVKQRHIKGCIKTFLRPYPVPFYLSGKLWEQLIERGRNKVK